VSLLLQLLVATLLIAVMVAARMVSDRRVMQQRMACEHYSKAKCSGGCTKHESATEN